MMPNDPNEQTNRKGESVKIEDFINKARYDDYGTFLWGEAEDGSLQMIADVRGWGAIQNLFKTEKEATEFQDELGKFMADAINEKLERDSK